MRTFGRKGLTPVAAPVVAPAPPVELPPETPAFEVDDPPHAGRALFEIVERVVSNDRGRAEDVLAMLAAAAGFSCILAAFDEVREAGVSPQGLGMILVEPKDKHRYWFGDLPNRYLVDGEDTVIGHTLGAVRRRGGDMTSEVIEGILRRVAGSVGTPLFGVPVVSALHMPGDEPINYVKFLWPKLAAALDQYQVPIRQRPSTFGVALETAIDALAGATPSVGMTVAAQIVIECAVPMAKLDPARFGF
ncbi:hypothetical protein [Sphingomonas immobilis]|uniref:Uncharacterized protein n=1 Tax=Sphingomonas immobilis TaxID=3063997 RepID=A0ABT9A3A9_9SPHN|nr:hypothetical protein [Sphingomonas sp. CA1-15]MDO7844329.1 hypothetical protein [Sphingomonas sp. CA1-15]